jgi:hypothetical protein
MLRLIMPFAVGLLAGLGGTSALAVTRAKDAAKHAVPAKSASDGTHADSAQAGERPAVAAATPAVDTTHAGAPADSAHAPAPPPAPPARTPVKAPTPKRPPAPAVVEAHTDGHDALDKGTGTAPAAKTRADTKAGAAPRLPGREVVERLVAASTVDAKVPAEQRLAKYFGAMPAKDAAKILEQMDDRDVQTILSFVGDRQAAAILGSLSPRRAASIGRASLRPQPTGR